MTSIRKNVYIDKLDDMVNQYNNTYHRTIKMKPINVKGNTYIKVGNHVRISKCKNTFAKGYTTNGLKKSLSLEKLKIQSHGIM